MLKDLTVVIPTIGRSSVYNAVKSVPPECNIVISVDKNYKEEVNDIYRTYKDNPNITVITSFGHGPGITKQSGIWRANTKYFIILDDDDTYNPGALTTLVELMDEGYDYIMCSNLYGDRRIVLNRNNFSELLFNYEMYSDDYARNHIYTGGGTTIYNTDYFKRNHLTFNYPIMDDIIQNCELALNGYGLYIDLQVIDYSKTEGSVNRSRRTWEDHKPLIDILTQRMFHSYDMAEFNIWNKAIRNLYLRSIHNNRGKPLS